MVDVPQEVTDGTIRAIACGLLEYPARENFHLFDEDGSEALRAEIEHLVICEFKALDWKLSSIAHREGREFILLGAMGGTPALPTRAKIGQGTLQEVCKAAVRWLDDGPQPTPTPAR